MTNLSGLEREARERRERLAATFLDLRARTTPRALADEALAAIDPRLALLGKAAAALKRYPLIAAGVVTGAAFLLRRALNGAHPESPVRPRARKRIRNSHR